LLCFYLFRFIASYVIRTPFTADLLNNNEKQTKNNIKQQTSPPQKTTTVIRTPFTADPLNNNEKQTKNNKLPLPKKQQQQLSEHILQLIPSTVA
jgi:hypothetical protein